MLGLISILGGGLVLAASAAADIQLPWWAQVLVAVSGTAVTALVSLLGRALNQLFQLLAEKTKLAFLAQVDEHIMGYVSSVSQNEVAKLKAAAADGKLTPAEIAEIKAIPMDAAKELFGKKLAALLGSADAVDSFLASRVERAVVALKAAKQNP